MKPRTKLQKEVLALSKHLKPCPKRVFEWARKTVLDHYAYRLKSNKTVCLECGHEFETDKSSGEIRCPHCHARVELKTTTKSVYEDKAYFSYLTTVGGMQVLRTFLLTISCKKGRPARYGLYEICQHYITESGKIVLLGLKRTLGRHMDTFVFDGQIELRNDSICYRCTASQWLAPYKNVAPYIKKHGFNGDAGRCNLIELLKAILFNPKYETIMKNKDMDVMDYMLTYASWRINNYWSEYKIAKRNHYQIKDVGIWCDLIDALRFCNKDTHNAHYICPDDLHAAHDYWIGRREKVRKQAEREKQRKEAQEAQPHYNKVKSKFFGLTISDQLINISVVDKVDDFYKLGEEMHICLGAMKYYNKDNSLILLAKAGNEVKEVIELSLETLQVIQSRSYCNKPSDCHERIVKLVEDNVNLIAKRKSA